MIKVFPYVMHPNVPRRMVKVTSSLSNDEPSQVFGLHLLSVTDFDINNIMLPGGLEWDDVVHAFYGETYKIYPLEQNDIMVLAVNALGKDKRTKTRIREVNVQCLPEKIDEMVPGEVQTFKFMFTNIFEEATELMIAVEYGDGKIKEKTYSGVDKIGIQTKHIYNDITDMKFKATLYDITGGKKEIISELVIPVYADKQVKIKANHTIFQLGEGVEFETNIQNQDYRYEWDFGDSDSTRETGSYKATFTYTEKGFYTVIVDVYDATDRFIGSGVLDLECREEEPNITESVVDEPSIFASSDRPVVGDSVNIFTNVQNDDYLPLDYRQ